MESKATTKCICDTCGGEIKNPYGKSLSLYLSDEDGSSVQRNWCSQQCLFGYPNKNKDDKKLESHASYKTYCDQCGKILGESYPKSFAALSLPLESDDGNSYDGRKTHHFCGISCLNGHLTKRLKDEKDKKNSMASVSYTSTAMEIDITKNNESYGRYISTKKREEMKDSDFLDSERRSFPVKNCEDVKSAVHAWGRYRGSMSFEEFKSKLTRKAKELGCSLPEKWEDE